MTKVEPVKAEKTYWNGEECECRKVSVVVGPSPISTWWCADLEGQERQAVEVDYGPSKFYLDNDDGSGWGKVTVGRGSPWCSHRSLPVSRVIPVTITPQENGHD